MTQPSSATAHERAAYVPPAKYTRSGDSAQCCPHAIAVAPGSCQYCWELHKAACAPCWERHLEAIMANTYCVADTDGDGNCAACAHNPQALCRKPRRASLDDLTRDQLDQLYTRAEQAEAAIHHLREQHVKILRDRIKTGMAETAGWKAAWQLAHDRSAKHRERADRAEKRITLARAEAEEWHTYFLDGGDAPATHALAMVLLLIDQTPPTD